MQVTTDIGSEQQGEGELVAYFGYGSLVNRATHRTRIVDAFPARLVGWRRFWRPRPDMPGFPAALLTVREEEGAVCDGLLVIDRAANLAAVDEREARYRRLPLLSRALETSQPVPEGCPVFVYVAEEDIPAHPGPPAILRSYLEAVLQGFLVEHGEQAVRRFMAETHGFDTPLHDDRAAPVYPRAVTLSESEKTLFESLLAERVPGRS
jgi:cation transport regulator ChaC